MATPCHPARQVNAASSPSPATCPDSRDRCQASMRRQREGKANIGVSGIHP